MTKRWKLKTNSSNILLVLITLILVKAECLNLEDADINSIDSNSTQIYIGHDEIANYYFHSSSSNSSFILNGINNCLDNFQFITCIKMLLLNRVNDVVNLLEEPQVRKEDISLLNGMVVLKRRNETEFDSEELNDTSSLDNEITAGIRRIFVKRSLMVKILPRMRIEFEPVSGKQSSDFVCFSYRILNGPESELTESSEGRKKKGGMPMMMILPPLIMMGLMPFTLASLKAMVMNAVMINMMALNGAIFMTIRNLVFGPRQGDNVKYVNYGYSKDRQTQSPKPVLIIHSKAAFVKQPPVPKKHYYHAPQHQEVQYVQPYHNEVSSNDYDYVIIEQNENQHHNRRLQGLNSRNDIRYDTARPVNPFQRYNPNSNQRIANNVRNKGSLKANSQGYSTINDNSEKQFQTNGQLSVEKTEFKPSPQWNAVGNS